MVTTRERKRKYSRQGNKKLIEQFDFIEIYNACERDEVNIRAAKLARKYGRPGFGGSDAHKLECIGRGWADLPDTIKNENDLIEFVKTKPEIHCGGSFYDNTIRDKLGKWNAVRIDGFFFYNKLGAVSKLLKRKRELKKLYPEYKETMKGRQDPETPLDMRNMQNL